MQGKIIITCSYGCLLSWSPDDHRSPVGDIKWNRQDLTLQYCSEEINCLDCLSPVGVHNGEIYFLTYFEQLFVCKIDHSAVQLLGLEVDNCTLIDRIYEHCMIYGSIKDVFRAIFIGSYTECIHPLPPPCQAPLKVLHGCFLNIFLF
jgi:hypothetical protein